MFTRLLVPFDGSEGATRALASAREIAEKFNSELVVLTVVRGINSAGWTLPKSAAEALEADTEYLQQGETIQQSAKELLQGFQGSVTYCTRQGAPVARVLDEVDRQECDAIVMGHRGLSTVKKWLLGSVSDETSQLCSVPILIVK